MSTFDRDELRVFLDRKSLTLSFSVVDHLRWDLKQIFDMAVAEGYLQRSPAALLFTPRECRLAATRVMPWKTCDRCYRFSKFESS
ncbi:MAG: hypothetical protein JO138_02250 [Acidobacteriaceae bacterium]|nr:hypothetical protein [Acidobacteriaceae bacterium]